MRLLLAVALLVPCLAAAADKGHSVEILDVAGERGLVTGWIVQLQGGTFEAAEKQLKKKPLKLKAKKPMTLAEAQEVARSIRANSENRVKVRVLDPAGKEVKSDTVPVVAHEPVRKPLKAGPRCIVQSVAADVSDAEGGMPCPEAEELAKKLRAGGIEAKAVPAP